MPHHTHTHTHTHTYTQTLINTHTGGSTGMPQLCRRRVTVVLCRTATGLWQVASPGLDIQYTAIYKRAHIFYAQLDSVQCLFNTHIAYEKSHISYEKSHIKKRHTQKSPYIIWTQESPYLIWLAKLGAAPIYEVATIHRLPKNIGLFCKRALWKRLYSAKDTYILKEPTNHSHTITRSPILWLFPLKMRHPRNPPNREIQFPWYLAVQIQIEILVWIEFVPRDLGVSILWILGV